MLEKCKTPQSVTIVIFKKDITAQYWPQLSKIVLAYVKIDLSRWLWDGDEPEDVDGDGTTLNRSSAGTEIEGKQVFPLRIDLEVFAFDNGNYSQIKALPFSQRRQRHRSCGPSIVLRLRE